MWAPSGPQGPAGWDRRRVGARLRAALAGLQELQGLRATQQARVRGALAMQPPPGPAAPRGPRAHELRLEAALEALQERLVRGAGGGWAVRLTEGHPLGFQGTQFGLRRDGRGGPRVRIPILQGARGLHPGAAASPRGRALSGRSWGTSGAARIRAQESVSPAGGLPGTLVSGPGHRWPCCAGSGTLPAGSAQPELSPERAQVKWGPVIEQNSEQSMYPTKASSTSNCHLTCKMTRGL